MRAKEFKALGKKGKAAVLSKSRWCLLKRPENLTEAQDVKLKELLACNLKTVRAYLLKEDFQSGSTTRRNGQGSSSTHGQGRPLPRPPTG